MSEVSIKAFDGRSVHATGVLAEAGELLISIIDVTLCAILEEVDQSNNRSVVEPMVEGRPFQILSENHVVF